MAETLQGRDGYQKESLGKVFASEAMTVAARKKLGAVPEWEAFSWKVLDHKRIDTSRILVRGAVPIGYRTKGGGPIWGKVKDSDHVTISNADIEAAKREFELASGKCSDCVEGQYCCGVSVADGYKYRPCSRCNGTGRPLSVLRSPDQEKP